MECPVCRDGLDAKERRPKSLPCGHTVCLHCVQRLQDKLCPQCRKAIAVPVQELPDNFFLLGLIGQRTETAIPFRRMWCVDCAFPATERCWDEHEVLPPKSALRRQLQEPLRRAAEDLQGLQDVQGCGEDQAFAALQMLRGDNAVWNVRLTREDGNATLQAQWQTQTHADGVPSGKDALAKGLVAVLALKCGLRQVPPPAVQGEQSVIPELEVRMAHCEPNEAGLKTAILERVRARGVRRLKVFMSVDAAFVLNLLRNASPSVEELCIPEITQEQFRVMYTMPRLRRVELWGYPFHVELPPPPPGHVSRVEYLSVRKIYPEVLESLLRAYAVSLRTVVLHLDLICCNNQSGDEIVRMLERCNLRKLQHLYLSERWVCSYGSRADIDECFTQKAAMEQVLPAAKVHCMKCDTAEPERF